MNTEKICKQAFEFISENPDLFQKVLLEIDKVYVLEYQDCFKLDNVTIMNMKDVPEFMLQKSSIYFVVFQNQESSDDEDLRYFLVDAKTVKKKKALQVKNGYTFHLN